VITLHDSLTNTKSASGISVPIEFKAEAKKLDMGWLIVSG
jgi:hypothetical protein